MSSGPGGGEVGRGGWFRHLYTRADTGGFMAATVGAGGQPTVALRTGTTALSIGLL